MKVCAKVFITIFILLLSVCFPAKAEVFTALVDLEPLLRTEEEITKSLGLYLKMEQERLEKIKWLWTEYEKLYKAAIIDGSTFLSNPVNAYLLVKRLTADWEFIGRLADGSYSKTVLENVTQQGLPFPDLEDLHGAAAALLRLQDTYLLDTTQLAKGEIQGTKVSSKLYAGDCFQLGHQALGSQDYYHSVLWMQEALDRLEEEEVKTADKTAALEYAAYSTFMLGNVKHAIKLTQDLITIAPDHPRAYMSLMQYQSTLYTGEGYYKGEDEFLTDEQSQKISLLKLAPQSIFQNYENLCRGERIRTAKEESQLYCRYTSNNSSYLLLQPVKEEVLSLHPKIVVYHDVISDKDIELFKQLGLPKLTRAKVHNPESGIKEIVHYRVSKSAWLADDEHPRVEHASKMIDEITGLNMATSEEMHLINYGIGGHYEPHCDFKRVGEADNFAYLGTGNRIATWIYYLSDVDAGGSTVFPNIGLQVKPKKGSAAFWYNLMKNGTGDMRTMHAACPVLAGSKWVANKWIHEVGQEFRRRCGLNQFE